MAAERGNAALADLADAAHPAVAAADRARLLGRRRARSLGGGVRRGGGGPGHRPPLLVGLGVRELSVAAPALGRIKALVRSLDALVFADVAAQAVACSDAEQVRALVSAQLDPGQLQDVEFGRSARRVPSPGSDRGRAQDDQPAAIESAPTVSPWANHDQIGLSAGST